MKIIIIMILGIAFSLYSTTLFLNERDTGEIYIKSGFITSLTFDVPVQTVFLGDTENFVVELSGDKKIVAIWSVGTSGQSNLIGERGRGTHLIKLIVHVSAKNN